MRIRRALYYLNLLFKERLRSHLSPTRIAQIKALLLSLGYVFHWIRLANEIRYYKMLGKSPPILLCIANPSSVGGTELQVQIIAEALKTRLGDCLVLISGNPEEGTSNHFVQRLKSLKIQLLRLGSVGLIHYDQHPSLKKCTAWLLQIAIGNSKICHFFNPRSTVLAPVIANLGLASYYMETGMPSSGEWYKILHTTISQLNYVTSVSCVGLRYLEFLYGYRGPSCITPSMFHSPPDHFICRKPIKGIFDIVYFGRMTEDKGIDLLIRSFHHLIKDFPYATLSLIGFGEKLPQFKKLVKEFSLSNQVHFTNWLHTDQLFSRLITTDLFCLPSYTEGLPSSILEAMSIGLPIVATNVGGISEIIEHNVSGILVPPGDEESLTKALLELANNPALRLQLGENALLLWRKAGTKEVILNRLMAAYQTTFTFQ